MVAGQEKGSGDWDGMVFVKEAAGEEDVLVG